MFFNKKINKDYLVFIYIMSKLLLFSGGFITGSLFTYYLLKKSVISEMISDIIDESISDSEDEDEPIQNIPVSKTNTIRFEDLVLMMEKEKRTNSIRTNSI